MAGGVAEDYYTAAWPSSVPCPCPEDVNMAELNVDDLVHVT